MISSPRRTFIYACSFHSPSPQCSNAGVAEVEWGDNATAAVEKREAYMADFIEGTLERNAPGATYEGIVYDRVLTIRNVEERRLSVFDSEAISADLFVGELYEMLLQPLMPVSTRYSPMRPTDLDPFDCVGEVIALRWRAAGRTFRCAISDVYEREWILLATALGQLLVSKDSITVRVEVGSFLCWHESRLDLVAVV